MSNVVSMLDRLEKWTVAYESPDGMLKIKASNHGRMSFQFVKDSGVVTLDFVDSVDMLSRLSEGMNFALDVM